MIAYHTRLGEARPLPAGFYLVSRPKVGGLVTHYGVLSTGMGPDVVYQLCPEGYQVLSYRDFTAGKTVTFHARRGPEHTQEIMGRLHRLQTRRPFYNVLHNNCEHAARWLLEGRRVSTQLQGPLGRGLQFLGLVPMTT